MLRARQGGGAWAASAAAFSPGRRAAAAGRRRRGVLSLRSTAPRQEEGRGGEAFAARAGARGRWRGLSRRREDAPGATSAYVA
eukprot:364644-Chlamydomonas_euryale.AAC.10